MMFFLSVFLAAILTLLSLLHIYWAFGGKWGFSSSLPMDASNNAIFTPGPLASMTVSIVLAIFAIFYFNSVLNNWTLPPLSRQIFQWGIPSLFLLRGIGDFNYVGLFKARKDTAFAISDTRLFTPLCLTMAAIGYLIVVLK